MSPAHPIIVEVVETKLLTATPKSRPNYVYVLTYPDGGLRVLPGAPSAGDRWGSNFCYIVDVSEHRVSGTLSLPARGDAYSFSATLEATWTVADPEAVVRAGLMEGDGVVLAHLQDLLWVVGRKYHPEEASQAEADARLACSSIREIPGGLAVVRCSVRVLKDKRLTAAAVQIDQDAHQGRREDARMAGLRRMLADDESMLLLHLLRHPGDTGDVLQMIVAAKDRSESVRLGLLDRMLAHGFIQDSDVQGLRDTVLGASSTGSPSSIGAPRTALPASDTSVAHALPVATQHQPHATVARPPAQPSRPAEDQERPAERAPAADAGHVKGWTPLRKRPDVPPS